MTTVMNTETLEEIAERLVRTYCAVIDGITLTASERTLANEILSALRNERESRFELTEREKRILIDHHNYEAEKAVTRMGCRVTERYHRDRAKAIREGR